MKKFSVIVSMYAKQIIVSIFSMGILMSGMSAPAFADVQLTSLRDFRLGTIYPPYSSNLRQTDRVCVYNSSATTYRMSATGLHDVGCIFHLANGSHTIRYRVRWDGPVGAFQTFCAGQAVLFDGAHRIPLCAGVPTSRLARLRIIIRSAWLNPTPPAGTYSDTLLLMIESDAGTSTRHVDISLTIP